MRTFLRRVRGLLGIALSWALLWAGVIFAIGTVISVVDPGSIDVGEEPWRMALTIVAPIGFVSGLVFGGLLMGAEGRKSIRDLSFWRVALWGAIGGAVLPALGIIDAPLVNTMPLGAIASTLTVALARRGAPRPESRTLASAADVALPIAGRR